MMNRCAAVLFSGILFFSVLSFAAETSETGAGILKRPMSARMVGLGEAYTAMAEDIHSIGVNPGGLAKIEDPELTTNYLRGIVDDHFGAMAYGHPVGNGTLFVGGMYYDAGNIDLNLSGGTQKTVKAEQDIVGMLGVAWGRNWPVSLGVTAKYYSLELAESAKASDYAIDSGLVWSTPVDGLNFGASAQNIGPEVEFEEEADPLPLTYRGGAKYVLDFSRFSKFKVIPYKLLFVADGIKVKEEDAAFLGGLELFRDFRFMDNKAVAYLRGGYRSDPQKGTLGVGFQLSNIKLDYSIQIGEDSEDVHLASLGYVFRTAEENKINNPLRW